MAETEVITEKLLVEAAKGVKRSDGPPARWITTTKDVSGTYLDLSLLYLPAPTASSKQIAREMEERIDTRLSILGARRIGAGHSGGYLNKSDLELVRKIERAGGEAVLLPEGGRQVVKDMDYVLGVALPDGYVARTEERQWVNPYEGDTYAAARLFAAYPTVDELMLLVQAQPNPAIATWAAKVSAAMVGEEKRKRQDKAVVSVKKKDVVHKPRNLLREGSLLFFSAAHNNIPEVNFVSRNFHSALLHNLKHAREYQPVAAISSAVSAIHPESACGEDFISAAVRNRVHCKENVVFGRAGHTNSVLVWFVGDTRGSYPTRTTVHFPPTHANLVSPRFPTSLVVGGAVITNPICVGLTAFVVDLNSISATRVGSVECVMRPVAEGTDPGVYGCSVTQLSIDQLGAVRLAIALASDVERDYDGVDCTLEKYGRKMVRNKLADMLGTALTNPIGFFAIVRSMQRIPRVVRELGKDANWADLMDDDAEMDFSVPPDLKSLATLTGCLAKPKPEYAETRVVQRSCVAFIAGFVPAKLVEMLSPMLNTTSDAHINLLQIGVVMTASLPIGFAPVANLVVVSIEESLNRNVCVTKRLVQSVNVCCSAFSEELMFHHVCADFGLPNQELLRVAWGAAEAAQGSSKLNVLRHAVFGIINYFSPLLATLAHIGNNLHHVGAIHAARAACADLLCDLSNTLICGEHFSAAGVVRDLALMLDPTVEARQVGYREFCTLTADSVVSALAAVCASISASIHSAQLDDRMRAALRIMFVVSVSGFAFTVLSQKSGFMARIAATAPVHNFNRVTNIARVEFPSGVRLCMRSDLLGLSRNEEIEIMLPANPVLGRLTASLSFPTDGRIVADWARALREFLEFVCTEDRTRGSDLCRIYLPFTFIQMLSIDCGERTEYFLQVHPQLADAGHDAIVLAPTGIRSAPGMDTDELRMNITLLFMVAMMKPNVVFSREVNEHFRLVSEGFKAFSDEMAGLPPVGFEVAVRERSDDDVERAATEEETARLQRAAALSEARANALRAETNYATIVRDQNNGHTVAAAAMRAEVEMLQVERDLAEVRAEVAVGAGLTMQLVQERVAAAVRAHRAEHREVPNTEAQLRREAVAAQEDRIRQIELTARMDGEEEAARDRVRLQRAVVINELESTARRLAPQSQGLGRQFGPQPPRRGRGRGRQDIATLTPLALLGSLTVGGLQGARRMGYDPVGEWSLDVYLDALGSYDDKVALRVAIAEMRTFHWVFTIVAMSTFVVSPQLPLFFELFRAPVAYEVKRVLEGWRVVDNRLPITQNTITGELNRRPANIAHFADIKKAGVVNDVVRTEFAALSVSAKSAVLDESAEVSYHAIVAAVRRRPDLLQVIRVMDATTQGRIIAGALGGLREGVALAGGDRQFTIVVDGVDEERLRAMEANLEVLCKDIWRVFATPPGAVANARAAQSSIQRKKKTAEVSHPALELIANEINTHLIQPANEFAARYLSQVATLDFSLFADVVLDSLVLFDQRKFADSGGVQSLWRGRKTYDNYPVLDGYNRDIYGLRKTTIIVANHRKVLVSSNAPLLRWFVDEDLLGLLGVKRNKTFFNNSVFAYAHALEKRAGVNVSYTVPNELIEIWDLTARDMVMAVIDAFRGGNMITSPSCVLSTHSGSKKTAYAIDYDNIERVRYDLCGGDICALYSARAQRGPAEQNGKGRGACSAGRKVEINVSMKVEEGKEDKPIRLLYVAESKRQRPDGATVSSKEAIAMCLTLTKDFYKALCCMAQHAITLNGFMSNQQVIASGWDSVEKATLIIRAIHSGDVEDAEPLIEMHTRIAGYDGESWERSCGVQVGLWIKNVRTLLAKSGVVDPLVVEEFLVSIEATVHASFKIGGTPFSGRMRFMNFSGWAATALFCLSSFLISYHGAICIATAQLGYRPVSLLVSGGDDTVGLLREWDVEPMEHACRAAMSGYGCITLEGSWPAIPGETIRKVEFCRSKVTKMVKSKPGGGKYYLGKSFSALLSAAIADLSIVDPITKLREYAGRAVCLAYTASRNGNPFIGMLAYSFPLLACDSVREVFARPSAEIDSRLVEKILKYTDVSETESAAAVVRRLYPRPGLDELRKWLAVVDDAEVDDFPDLEAAFVGLGELVDSVMKQRRDWYPRVFKHAQEMRRAHTVMKELGTIPIRPWPEVIVRETVQLPANLRYVPLNWLVMDRFKAPSAPAVGAISQEFDNYPIPPGCGEDERAKLFKKYFESGAAAGDVKHMMYTRTYNTNICTLEFPFIHWALGNGAHIIMGNTVRPTLMKLEVAERDKILVSTRLDEIVPVFFRAAVYKRFAQFPEEAQQVLGDEMWLLFECSDPNEAIFRRKRDSDEFADADEESGGRTAAEKRHQGLGASSGPKGNGKASIKLGSSDEDDVMRGNQRAAKVQGRLPDTSKLCRGAPPGVVSFYEDPKVPQEAKDARRAKAQERIAFMAKKDSSVLERDLLDLNTGMSLNWRRKVLEAHLEYHNKLDVMWDERNLAMRNMLAALYNTQHNPPLRRTLVQRKISTPIYCSALVYISENFPTAAHEDPLLAQIFPRLDGYKKFLSLALNRTMHSSYGNRCVKGMTGSPARACAPFLLLAFASSFLPQQNCTAMMMTTNTINDFVPPPSVEPLVSVELRDGATLYEVPGPELGEEAFGGAIGEAIALGLSMGHSVTVNTVIMCTTGGRGGAVLQFALLPKDTTEWEVPVWFDQGLTDLVVVHPVWPTGDGRYFSRLVSVCGTRSFKLVGQSFVPALRKLLDGTAEPGALYLSDGPMARAKAAVASVAADQTLALTGHRPKVYVVRVDGSLMRKCTPESGGFLDFDSPIYFAGGDDGKPTARERPTPAAQLARSSSSASRLQQRPPSLADVRSMHGSDIDDCELHAGPANGDPHTFISDGPMPHNDDNVSIEILPTVSAFPSESYYSPGTTPVNKTFFQNDLLLRSVNGSQYELRNIFLMPEVVTATTGGCRPIGSQVAAVATDDGSTRSLNFGIVGPSLSEAAGFARLHVLASAPNAAYRRMNVWKNVVSRSLPSMEAIGVSGSGHGGRVLVYAAPSALCHSVVELDGIRVSNRLFDALTADADVFARWLCYTKSLPITDLFGDKSATEVVFDYVTENDPYCERETDRGASLLAALTWLRHVRTGKKPNVVLTGAFLPGVDTDLLLEKAAYNVSCKRDGPVPWFLCTDELRATEAVDRLAELVGTATHGPKRVIEEASRPTEGPSTGRARFVKACLETHVIPPGTSSGPIVTQERAHRPDYWGSIKILGVRVQHVSDSRLSAVEGALSNAANLLENLPIVAQADMACRLQFVVKDGVVAKSTTGKRLVNFANMMLQKDTESVAAQAALTFQANPDPTRIEGDDNMNNQRSGIANLFANGQGGSLTDVAVVIRNTSYDPSTKSDVWSRTSPYLGVLGCSPSTGAFVPLLAAGTQNGVVLTPNMAEGVENWTNACVEINCGGTENYPVATQFTTMSTGTSNGFQFGRDVVLGQYNPPKVPITQTGQAFMNPFGFNVPPKVQHRLNSAQITLPRSGGTVSGNLANWSVDPDQPVTYEAAAHIVGTKLSPTLTILAPKNTMLTNMFYGGEVTVTVANSMIPMNGQGEPAGDLMGTLYAALTYSGPTVSDSGAAARHSRVCMQKTAVYSLGDASGTVPIASYAFHFNFPITGACDKIELSMSYTPAQNVTTNFDISIAPSLDGGVFDVLLETHDVSFMSFPVVRDMIKNVEAVISMGGVMSTAKTARNALVLPAQRGNVQALLLRKNYEAFWTDTFRDIGVINARHFAKMSMTEVIVPVAALPNPAAVDIRPIPGDEQLQSGILDTVGNLAAQFAPALLSTFMNGGSKEKDSGGASQGGSGKYERELLDRIAALERRLTAPEGHRVRERYDDEYQSAIRNKTVRRAVAAIGQERPGVAETILKNALESYKARVGAGLTRRQERAAMVPAAVVEQAAEAEVKPKRQRKKKEKPSS